MLVLTTLKKQVIYKINGLKAKCRPTIGLWLLARCKEETKLSNDTKNKPVHFYKFV